MNKMEIANEIVRVAKLLEASVKVRVSGLNLEDLVWRCKGMILQGGRGNELAIREVEDMSKRLKMVADEMRRVQSREYGNPDTDILRDSLLIQLSKIG